MWKDPAGSAGLTTGPDGAGQAGQVTPELYSPTRRFSGGTVIPLAGPDSNVESGKP